MGMDMEEETSGLRPEDLHTFTREALRYRALATGHLPTSTSILYHPTPLLASSG